EVLQRPDVDIEPGCVLEDGLASQRLQVLAALTLGLSGEQLAQAPDRGIHRAAGAFGVQLRPKQLRQLFAAVSAIRISEKETGQSPRGWAGVAPDPPNHRRPSAHARKPHPQNARPPA